MNILIINDNVNINGGAERVIFNLVKFLKKDSHRVTLLGFTKGNPDDVIDKSSINLQESRLALVRLMERIFISPRLYFQISEIVKKVNPDLIDIHLTDKYPLTVLLATRGFPSIRTIHDFGILCLGKTGISSDGQRLCLNGISLQCLINKSASLKQFLALYITQKIYAVMEKKQINVFNTSNKIIYKNLIKRKYNNVYLLQDTINIGSIENTSKNNQYVNRKLKKFIDICYIGSLGEHKGVEFLIKSLPIVKKTIPVRLKIISKDKNISSMKRLSRQLNIREDVRFLTNISYKASLNELKKSTLLVLPSTCMENSPLVILEAMALGIPVVASDIGGIPDLVIDGKTGYLFKPRNVQNLADKILKLVKTPELAKKMGNYAKEIYNRKYQPKNHYYKLMNIYKFAFSLKR